MYRQDYDETMPFQVNGSLWTFHPTGHRFHGEPNQCNDIRYTTEAWRHNGTCYVLFYDGPVKSLKQGLHIQLRSILRLGPVAVRKEILRMMETRFRSPLQ